MPRLIDSQSRTEALGAAATDLLVREGPQALTLRGLARASGISTSSMLHHYGTREHLFRVLAWRCGKERLEDISIRLPFDKVAAFLPGAEQLATATAWQAWIELSRCEPAWQRTVDDVLEHERGLLAVELELPYADDRVSTASALVSGLVGAMGRHSRPLAPEAAQRALELAVPLLEPTPRQ